MSKATFKFDSDEERDLFIGWFLDGGGRSSFWLAGDDNGHDFRTRYVQPSTIHVHDDAKKI